MLAGHVTFFEGWYTVGSTVVIDPMTLEGVAEGGLAPGDGAPDHGGELIRDQNSRILAPWRLPDGASRLRVSSSYATARSIDDEARSQSGPRHLDASSGKEEKEGGVRVLSEVDGLQTSRLLPRGGRVGRLRTKRRGAGGC